MQRGIRINDAQLYMLAEKARSNLSSLTSGYLYKRSTDSARWQLRWFVLYQNLLFYYENETFLKLSGIIFLEGSYCERLLASSKKDGSDIHQSFAITYRKEGQRQYEFRAETEAECNLWIDAVGSASFNKTVLLKEEIEQKYLHLMQIVESERTAKWQYRQQCEELLEEIKKLRSELSMVNNKLNRKIQPQRSKSCSTQDEESEEIRKIKKVQSFFRGWMCRRRWKQIVEEYIRSPHAENMRKRNSLVFSMVECEEEYVRQLQTLVTCFLRPLRMAASSKKPVITHEDVNSIFLNSETVMFLHQIFLKGLIARMESWPKLVLGDLFDMLLPMLSIYQEYVRNHHYSLQVLAEYKQKPAFHALLKRFEEKPACEDRSLEMFLTYPMHQIPRYIITLHDLLAHTPHNHVERNSLEYAKNRLEELSQIMHDEVSETENIRKNLAIERMISEGCDILLDVNQTFVRQGSLIQVMTGTGKQSRGRLGSFNKADKEAVRQCFLFTNHLVLASRSSSGRLHLVKHPLGGKIPLVDATLVEDATEVPASADDETVSLASQVSSLTTLSAHQSDKVDYNGLDFKLIVDSKNGPPLHITFAASNLLEKSAWISDIGQCIENLMYNDLLASSVSDTSSTTTTPYSVRCDPRLFKDDVDIHFSKSMSSCKLPQIRYASVARLLERLTDVRFLSVDFLNTFLLTYRVFTTGITVLEALMKVYRNPEAVAIEGSTATLFSSGSQESSGPFVEFTISPSELRHSFSGGSMLVDKSFSRRVSSCSTTSTGTDISVDFPPSQHWRRSFRKFELGQEESGLKKITERLSPIPSPREVENKSFETHLASAQMNANILSVPQTSLPGSSESLINASSGPGTPTRSVKSTNVSNDTLVGQGSRASSAGQQSEKSSPPVEVRSQPSSPTLLTKQFTFSLPSSPTQALEERELFALATNIVGPQSLPSTPEILLKRKSMSLMQSDPASIKFLPASELAKRPKRKSSPSMRDPGKKVGLLHLPVSLDSGLRKALPTPISYSYSAPTLINIVKGRAAQKRASETNDSQFSVTPRSSFAAGRDGSPPAPAPPTNAGVVITSSRQSTRRSSSSHAAAAFAVATAASRSASLSSQREVQQQQQRGISRFYSAGSGESAKMYANSKRESQISVVSTAATMRVLNVLRHWVSKHQQDFDSSSELHNHAVNFMEEMVCNPNLLPFEHKLCVQLLHNLKKLEQPNFDLDKLLTPSAVKSKDSNFSALEIAEQMTVLDNALFQSIHSEEFLHQAWMRADKNEKAPTIVLITQRFNDMSKLVVSEILRCETLQQRMEKIEKWAAVADICRCLHNFNGVLQICSAFVNSSLYRLKSTWDKLPKATKILVEKLQNLCSSDGKFRNIREGVHRCDPPCIPYLGMYLSDLSFIEEGTPDFTDDGLVNFSKMRMVAHVIREVKQLQQNPYSIQHNKQVCNYLLDRSLLVPDESLYSISLGIEPRQTRIQHSQVKQESQ